MVTLEILPLEDVLRPKMGSGSIEQDIAVFRRSLTTDGLRLVTQLYGSWSTYSEQVRGAYTESQLTGQGFEIVWKRRERKFQNRPSQERDEEKAKQQGTLEQTLQRFNLDPETEARVRKIAEEFELKEKVRELVSPQKALKDIRGKNRKPIDTIYLSMLTTNLLQSYVSYVKYEIAQRQEPESFINFFRCAVKLENGSIDFVSKPRKGDFAFFYGKYANEKSKGRTTKNIFEWLRESAKNDDLFNEFRGLESLYAKRKKGRYEYEELKAKLRNAFSSYISYTQSEVDIGRNPRRFKTFLTSAVIKDRTITFTEGRGDFVPLYNRYITEKMRGITKKDLLDWIKNHIEGDPLFNVVMNLDALHAKKMKKYDTKQLQEEAIASFKGYTSYVQSEVKNGSIPKSFSRYLSRARIQEDEVMFGKRTKGDFGSLYNKHRIDSNLGKTTKKLRAWLKEQANDDELFDRAMQMEALYANTGRHSSQQVIQSAIENLQIPTDAASLSRLVNVFGEDANGVNDLVDLLYVVKPAQIWALEAKKIGRRELVDYLRQHLTGDSGKATGSGSGYLPPFQTITRIVPFETYQKSAVARSQLLDIALRAYMSQPFNIAIQQIDTQLASNPNDRVLQNVLSEAKDYIERMGRMPESITKIRT